MLTQAPRTKLLLPQRRVEWMGPSAGPQPKYRWCLQARLSDGYVRWAGWFDDREDADEFLWAMVTGQLHIQPDLWRLPVPSWHPDIGEFPVVYMFLTAITINTGTTTWVVPSDWSNSNTLETIGAGGSGGSANALGNAGGAGAAYSKEVNQVYTAGTSVTVQSGTGGASVGPGGALNGNAGTDSFIKNNSNSANVVLAKGGPGGGSGNNVTSGPGGGAAGSGTGSTKTSGGNGGGANQNVPGAGGGGGGAGSASGSGTSGNTGGGGSPGIAGGTGGGTSGGGGGGSAASNANGGAGGNGTNLLGGSVGSGGGGGGGAADDGSALEFNGGAGGLYGGGGGGAGDTTSFFTATSGAGANGVGRITYTPQGLFRQNPMTAVGCGGPFFADPMQMKKKYSP